MADLKISQLTSATTPLAGTEVVPLVQSTTTKKVTVANLTAGRTVDVNILLANSANVDGNWKVQANASSSGLAGIGVNNNSGYGCYITYDNTGRYVGGGAGIRNIANTPIYIETNNTIIGQFDTSGNYVPATAAKGVNFTANTPAAGMTSQLLNWYEEGTWTPTYSGWTTDPTTASARYTRVGRLVTLTFFAENGAAVAGSPSIGGLPFTSSSANGASVAMKDMSGSSPGATAFGVIGNSATSVSSMTAATFTGLYLAFSVTYIV